jgi:hypothetical protein
LAGFDLKSYARAGAEARVRELNQELASIYRAFPDLAGGAGVHKRVPRKRRRKPMTAAQKKAVGERMKKYWAARRKTAKNA